MTGRTLSHYKIIQGISRGGMGIVYRSLDLNLDREVALKVLPPADIEQERMRSVASNITKDKKHKKG